MVDVEQESQRAHVHVKFQPRHCMHRNIIDNRCNGDWIKSSTRALLDGVRIAHQQVLQQLLASHDCCSGSTLHCTPRCIVANVINYVLLSTTALFEHTIWAALDKTRNGSSTRTVWLNRMRTACEEKRAANLMVVCRYQ